MEEETAKEQGQSKDKSPVASDVPEEVTSKEVEPEDHNDRKTSAENDQSSTEDSLTASNSLLVTDVHPDELQEPTSKSRDDGLSEPVPQNSTENGSDLHQDSTEQPRSSFSESGPVVITSGELEKEPLLLATFEKEV